MNTASRRGFLAAGAAVMASAAGCLGVLSNSYNPTAKPDEIGMTRPTQGPDDAPVRVIAFENFGCGHCATFNESVLPVLLDKHVRPGTVQYLHADFMLSRSAENYPAGNAARAVYETAGNDAFWPFGRAMYQYRSGSLSLQTIEDIAEAAGGVGTAARTAAKNGGYAEALSADTELGAEWGVDRTPTVFVEEEYVNPFDNGDPDPDALVEAVEAKL
ncbi:MAG: protein-disulfide isomerase [halophilic archaeon J07HX5]|jgi:Protein-disulfide isomerase|nr:MAG: protein-disulfide isomerase [halophilic archaeon J07HX5]